MVAKFWGDVLEPWNALLLQNYIGDRGSGTLVKGIDYTQPQVDRF